MTTNIKNTILQSIGNIFEKAEGSKMEDALFKKIEDDLMTLSGYFKLTRMQAFFLAHIFALNYKGDTVDFSDMVEYLKCNPMKLLAFSEDIEVLRSKGIIKRERSRHRPVVSLSNDQFTVNETITKAILNDQPFPDTNETIINVIDVLEKIYTLAEQREEKYIRSVELFRQTRLIVQSNQNFELLKKVAQMKLDKKDNFLYLYLIWETITGSEKTSIGRLGNIMFNRPTEKVMYTKKMLNNENELIKRELVELAPESFFNDTKLKLTDLSLGLLHETGIELFTKNNKNQDVTEPHSIRFKALFYNDENKKQLDLVKDILIDANMKAIQQRLQKKNLPKGVTILLYGPPGTGKTETVFQLAKSTHREIVKVDISQSKSFWFGESEKIIKKIFTNYRSYAKQCETTPILLFNEADAIISKRMDLSGLSVNQTENTIQNIILEELEKFEGIFIATTNLAENMDSAFDRRFLFKIKLNNPEISVKAKIWKSKLEGLTLSNCEILASCFNFSGGQIDNVVRKSEMHEIIYGTTLNIEDIVEFCKMEEMSKSNKIKIGYIKN